MMGAPSRAGAVVDLTAALPFLDTEQRTSMSSHHPRPLPIAALTVLAAGLALGGCSSFNLPSFGTSTPEAAPPPAAASLPSKYAPEELIGRWGYTSYQNEADRARTVTVARGQCQNPY